MHGIIMMRGISGRRELCENKNGKWKEFVGIEQSGENANYSS